MKVISFVGTIACFAVVLALEDEPKNPFKELIIGGSSASLGQIPYQVGLRDKHDNFNFCGGVIIHKMWIVSCRHCMYTNVSGILTLRRIDQFRGAVGTIVINSGTYYDFAERFFHPDDFDIVLLKTKVKINFNKQTKLIAINAKDPLKPDSVVTASGWGDLYYNGPQPNILQFIKVQIVAQSECKYGPDLFCTRRFKVGNGTCEGDSGGPVVFKSKLVGLTQGGESECKNLDTNINIAYFQSWINGHIKS